MPASAVPPFISFSDPVRFAEGLLAHLDETPNQVTRDPVIKTVIKNPLVDAQRRSLAITWLNAESPHVPGKTRLEVYVEKKTLCETASGGKGLGVALQKEDYPHWLKDHQKKQLDGTAKAAYVDLVTTAEKDEVEHYLRMVNSDIVAAAKEAQRLGP